MDPRRDVIAAAMLNTRGMRRGAPPVVNVLEFAPADIVAEARGDADYVLEEIDKAARPIPMVLHCPGCRAQHVDAPEPERGWTNPPHKSHLCHGCGLVWRPADVPTVGVVRVETRGSADTWPAEPESVAERPASCLRCHLTILNFAPKVIASSGTFHRECFEAWYFGRYGKRPALAAADTSGHAFVLKA